MHVLVTGANSFIGKHATVALAGAGLRVTASFRSEDVVVDWLRKMLPETEFARLDLVRVEDGGHEDWRCLSFRPLNR